jgi:site-specific DNA recombinase
MSRTITEIPPQYIPPERKKAGIYCRVSTSARSQLRSLPSQISDLVQRVNAMPRTDLVDIYIDIGSGQDDVNRPQIQRLMNDVASGRINTVVVRDLSRFARNKIDMLASIRTIRQHGGCLIDVIHNISTEDEDNDLYIAAMASIAEEESKSKSYNVKWGIQKRIVDGSSGLYNKKCYGYTHDESGELLIVPEQADVVKKIFSWYLEGKSIIAIQKQLKEEHIPSPRGGDTWPTRTIDKLLSNSKYVGDPILNAPGLKENINGQWQTVNRKYISEGNNPAIIDRTVYDEAY